MILRQISAQLNSFTMTPPFVNATHPTGPLDPAQAPFQAPACAVWLNALWFSSLVFSFASATLALFVKQWIYEATVTGTSRESARLRQCRLNGLIKWRVGAVVVALPILLQLSSILFLVGLSVFLWTLHTAVATVTSVLVGAFLSVFLTVTILPVLLSDCPFRSPASLAIYSVLRLARNQVFRLVRGLCKIIYRSSMQWADFINVARPQFDRLGAFAYEAYDNMPTWRGRDQNEIYVHHGALCRAIVTTAYTTTADKKFLSSMPVVFSDLPPDQVAMVFADLLEFMDAEWGHYHIPEQLHYQDPVTLPLCALYGLRHMLARSEKVPGWDVDVQIIFRHFFIGDEITEQLAELACKSLCQLAVEDRKNRRLFGLAYRTLQIMYDQQGARHTYETLSHGALQWRSCTGSARLMSFTGVTQLRLCTRWKWPLGIRLKGFVHSETRPRPFSFSCTVSVQRSLAGLRLPRLRPAKCENGVSSNFCAYTSGYVTWNGPVCTMAVLLSLEMPRAS